MNKLFTNLRLPLALLLGVIFTISTHTLRAQCTLTGSESPITIGVAPSCSSQATAGANGIGGGSYRYYSGTWTTGTWYSFSVSNAPGNINCAQAIFVNSSLGGISGWANVNATTGYLQAPAGSYAVLIETGRSSTWNGTSAQLTYQAVQPANPVWSSPTTAACAGTVYAYTVGAVSYATSYNWTVTSNSGNVTSNMSASTTSPTQNITFGLSSGTTGTVAVSISATNNGTCTSTVVATGTITVTAAPTATIAYTGSPWCASISSESPTTLTGTGAYTTGVTWTTTPSTGLTINSSGVINPSTSTSIVTGSTYTVNYNIAAAGGCAAVVATASVTVVAMPTAYATGGGGGGCSGLSGNGITLSGSQSGVNYQLNNTTTGLVGSTQGGSGSLLTFPGATSGTFNIIGKTALGGCSTTSTGTVTSTVITPTVTNTAPGTPNSSSVIMNGTD